MVWSEESKEVQRLKGTSAKRDQKIPTALRVRIRFHVHPFIKKFSRIYM